MGCCVGHAIGVCGFTVGDGSVRGIWLSRLQTVMAQAHGDEVAYSDFRDRYRVMATSPGFEGHI